MSDIGGDPNRYFSGFGGTFQSEALPGALPLDHAMPADM